MKKILFISAVIFLSAFTLLNNAFDFTVNSADGEEIPLNRYAGRKGVLAILPVTQTAYDTLLLQQINAAATNHGDSVIVVGIPSYEDGYADDSLQNLVPYWRSLAGNSVVLCTGMNTRKASPYQNELFTWLTNEEENGHFNEDVHAAGDKFLINENGDLYGVLSRETNLSEEAMF